MKRVKVSNEDDDPDVHMLSCVNDYATMCGLDGNDPTLGQEIMDGNCKEKINCQHCISIWKMSKKYKESDFE